jgi:hypothetical protein
MDEGFNDFIDAWAIADRSHAPFAVSANGYRNVAGTELEASMMWPTDYVGPNAGMTTYSKAPLALRALGGVVGDSAVHLAFAAYASSWRFKHPTPYDFFNSMNHSLGRNVDWFWYEWFFTNYTLDQAIGSVNTRNGNAEIVVHDNGDVVMPIVLKVEYTDGSSATTVKPADVWFSGSRSVTVSIPLGGKAIKTLALDPEDRFLDLGRSNNVWNADH